MPSAVRRWLHALFLWPPSPHSDAAMTDASPSALTPASAPNPARAIRAFVILRVHIGELGHVKSAIVKISCGNAEIDRRAATELSNTVFPTPRVGHKAVAQWHVMRWEVPADLRR